MKELTCIICPKGCIITQQKDKKLLGANCERGISYGKQELTNPTRTVTSTVIINNSILPRLPVKTDAPIAKALVLKAVRELNKVVLTPPVKIGDVVLENVLDSGVNFIASKNAFMIR